MRSCYSVLSSSSILNEIVQYLVEIIYGPRTLAFQAAFFKSF